MALLSIAERQRLAVRLASQEGAVLNHRHFLQIDEMITGCKQRKDNRVWCVKNHKKKLPAPPRKFSVEQAAAIRSHYDRGGVSYRDLARVYECGLRCINQVIKRWGAYKADP